MNHHIDIPDDIRDSFNQLHEIAKNFVDSYGSTDTEGQNFVTQAFASYFASLQSLKNDLDNFNADEVNSGALRIIQSLSTIDAQIEKVDVIILQTIADPFGKVGPQSTGTTNISSVVIGMLKSRLSAVLKGLSSRIWQFLSKYLNLDEWSIKGSVNTPTLSNFFGIKGGLELSVKFKP